MIRQKRNGACDDIELNGPYRKDLSQKNGAHSFRAEGFARWEESAQEAVFPIPPYFIHNRLGRCERNSERYLGGPSEQMAVWWELADIKSWFVWRVRSARQRHVVYGAGGRSILQREMVIWRSQNNRGPRKPTAIRTGPTGSGLLQQPTSLQLLRLDSAPKIHRRNHTKPPSNYELINRGYHAVPWAGKKKRKKRNRQRSIGRKAEEQERIIIFWGSQPPSQRVESTQQAPGSIQLRSLRERTKLENLTTHESEAAHWRKQRSRPHASG